MVSIDGSSIDVADTAENDKELGRHIGSRGKKRSAFLKLRFALLIEIGPYATTSEMDLARQVIESLKEGMLCLADRYYFGYDLWQTASQTKAQLLWRVEANLIQSKSLRSFLRMVPTWRQSTICLRTESIREAVYRYG